MSNCVVSTFTFVEYCFCFQAVIPNRFRPEISRRTEYAQGNTRSTYLRHVPTRLSSKRISFHEIRSYCHALCKTQRVQDVPHRLCPRLISLVGLRRIALRMSKSAISTARPLVKHDTYLYVENGMPKPVPILVASSGAQGYTKSNKILCTTTVCTPS